MKRFLSILLTVLMLGGVMMVTAVPAAAASNSLLDLIAFFTSNDVKKLTDKQLKDLISMLEILKKAGINYESLLKSYGDKLPIAAKAALHKAGVMKYPIWERSVFFNFIFKVFLFGWIWM